MIRTDSRLALALTLSLLAHLAPVLPELLRPLASRSPPPPPPPLQAQLRPPPAAVPLMLPEPTPPPAPPPAARRPPPARQPAAPAAARPGNWQQEVRRQFSQQQQRGDFYPVEAISRGLQGEVLVLLLLDRDGSVAAARVEQSSGHRLLDEAALRAARALRALPADAPRETLLPVNFRLN